MDKPQKYAIIQTGGKQYIVYEGQVLDVEKLENKTAVTFNEVLLAVNGENVKVGNPYVKGTRVKARVLEQIKGDKVRGFKYKSGTQYRKRYGHRQKLTRIEVEEIVV